MCIRDRLDEARAARSRSLKGRHHGVKAMLLSWAQGNSSAVTVWRLCNAIATSDGSDVGHGMSRLASLGSGTTGSEKNCAERLKKLLDSTALPKMVRPIEHSKTEQTVTHHLRPSDLIRLIHKQNRETFGRIFTACLLYTSPSPRDIVGSRMPSSA